MENTLELAGKLLNILIENQNNGKPNFKMNFSSAKNEIPEIIDEDKYKEIVDLLKNSGFVQANNVESYGSIKFDIQISLIVSKVDLNNDYSKYFVEKATEAQRLKDEEIKKIEEKEKKDDYYKSEPIKISKKTYNLTIKSVLINIIVAIASMFLTSYCQNQSTSERIAVLERQHIQDSSVTKNLQLQIDSMSIKYEKLNQSKRNK